MSKVYRHSLPPAGAHAELRNVRLYGSREEQISGAALRGRGCPNPDNAIVLGRKRADLLRERETRFYRERLQRAQTAMLEAQRAVKRARSFGHDTDALAIVARAARAEYLRLNGGTERRNVDASMGAEGTRV